MIELPEVDRHWYLWPGNTGHDAALDVLRHIQDPRIRPRRRPNIRRDAGISRDLSHDELPRQQVQATTLLSVEVAAPGDRRAARGATNLDTA